VTTRLIDLRSRHHVLCFSVLQAKRRRPSSHPNLAGPTTFDQATGATRQGKAGVLWGGTRSGSAQQFEGLVAMHMGRFRRGQLLHLFNLEAYRRSTLSLKSRPLHAPRDQDNADRPPRGATDLSRRRRAGLSRHPPVVDASCRPSEKRPRLHLAVEAGRQVEAGTPQPPLRCPIVCSCRQEMWQVLDSPVVWCAAGKQYPQMLESRH